MARSKAQQALKKGTSCLRDQLLKLLGFQLLEFLEATPNSLQVAPHYMLQKKQASLALVKRKAGELQG